MNSVYELWGLRIYETHPSYFEHPKVLLACFMGLLPSSSPAQETNKKAGFPGYEKERTSRIVGPGWPPPPKVESRFKQQPSAERREESKGKGERIEKEKEEAREGGRGGCLKLLKELLPRGLWSARGRRWLVVVACCWPFSL